MKCTERISTYLTSKSQCYIPKCKAHCCTNAPLPEEFLPRHKSQVQRKIYNAVNIGQNDPRDTFSSVIYNTTPNPVQLVGVDQNGKLMLAIPKEMLEQYNIRTQDQINELVEQYNQYDNYCPFITDYGKCSVYSVRPKICRDYGSTHLRVDHCSEKASRLEIAKLVLKDFFDVKGNFIFVKNLVKEKFKKGQ